jgi:acyl carrier protein
MAEPSLFAELAEIVRAVGKVPATTLITGESRLVEDLGIDSLDLVAVFLAVQDRFDVIVEDEVVPELRRVVDVAEHVVRLRASAAA